MALCLSRGARPHGAVRGDALSLFQAPRLALDPRRDLVRDGERRGEAGGFDPIEIDEAGDPMDPRPVDPEVGEAAARAHELGADPRIAGDEPVSVEPRIIAPDRPDETLPLAVVEPIVQAIDPAHVRTEPDGPGHI